MLLQRCQQKDILIVSVFVRGRTGVFGNELTDWLSKAATMPEINFAAIASIDSDVVQSGRPIFDDFFQHLWPYIGNNTANVVFQMVKHLWLIRVDQ
ncbi:hypothetical protein TNCV_2191451 [Trichonephila clavipes]|nr:hypothetical protein TNCV_2191451 [Trichonephila clavipes]